MALCDDDKEPCLCASEYTCMVKDHGDFDLGQAAKAEDLTSCESCQ